MFCSERTFFLSKLFFYGGNVCTGTQTTQTCFKERNVCFYNSHDLLAFWFWIWTCFCLAIKGYTQSLHLAKKHCARVTLKRILFTNKLFLWVSTHWSGILLCMRLQKSRKYNRLCFLVGNDKLTEILETFWK